MSPVRYDASRRSLYRPGDADDFFQLGDYASDAMLCAEMARLAYVKDEARLERYLARTGFDKVTLGYGGSGTQAFIATKAGADGAGVTVVAFRGSEPDDPKDLFADASFVMTDWLDAAGTRIGRVHGGFARACSDGSAFDHIQSHLRTLAPEHRVLLTGHSLGAALATLLASLTSTAHLYSFGSPRVGTPEFVRAIRNPVAVRYVDCLDVITRLPLETVLDFAHVGRQVYIDRNGLLIEEPADGVISADRLKARFGYWRYMLVPGNVLSRGLADHAPINYVSAVMGLRG